MNSAQKSFLLGWIIGIAVLLLMVLSSGFFPENRTIEGAIFLIVIGFIIYVQDKMGLSTGYGPKRLKLGQYLDEKPAHKYWIVTFTLVATPILCYLMINKIEVSGLFYGLYFLLLIGPVAYSSESEKYKNLADKHTENGK